MEAVCRYDVASYIAFNATMEEKGVKVVPTIPTFLFAADPLLSCLIHKLIIDEKMNLPCVGL